MGQEKQPGVISPISRTAQRAVHAFPALPDNALLPVDAVAIIVGLGRSTVWRKAREGGIPAPVRVGSRSTRWTAGSVRAYLNSLTQRGA